MSATSTTSVDQGEVGTGWHLWLNNGLRDEREGSWSSMLDNYEHVLADQSLSSSITPEQQKELSFVRTRIAYCQLFGLGCEKILWREAVEKLQLSANANDKFATALLGQCYTFGRGVPKNLIKARLIHQLNRGYWLSDLALSVDWDYVPTEQRRKGRSGPSFFLCPRYNYHGKPAVKHPYQPAEGARKEQDVWRPPSRDILAKLPDTVDTAGANGNDSSDGVLKVPTRKMTEYEMTVHLHDKHETLTTLINSLELIMQSTSTSASASILDYGVEGVEMLAWLGHFCIYGSTITGTWGINFDRGFHLLTMAAQFGHAQAQLTLGVAYDSRGYDLNVFLPFIHASFDQGYPSTHYCAAMECLNTTSDHKNGNKGKNGNNESKRSKLTFLVTERAEALNLLVYASEVQGDSASKDQLKKFHDDKERTIQMTALLSQRLRPVKIMETADEEEEEFKHNYQDHHHGDNGDSSSSLMPPPFSVGSINSTNSITSTSATGPGNRTSWVEVAKKAAAVIAEPTKTIQSATEAVQTVVEATEDQAVVDHWPPLSRYKKL